MILFTICSTGFAIENETDTHGNPSIKCGTEKGQHKAKNHRTAGMLKVNGYVYLPSDNHAWDFMSKFLKPIQWNTNSYSKLEHSHY